MITRTFGFSSLTMSATLTRCALWCSFFTSLSAIHPGVHQPRGEIDTRPPSSLHSSHDDAFEVSDWSAIRGAYERLEGSVGDLTGQSFEEESADSIAFVHEPVCEDLDTCKTMFVAQSAAKKLADTWAKLLPPEGQLPESSPGPTLLQSLSSLDGDGLVDDMKLGFLNFPVYALKLLAGKLLHALQFITKSRMDVRTTFGLGPNWTNLPFCYTTGDQLEGSQTTPPNTPPVRPRVIHSQGGVAKVKFVPKKTGKYSGMLEEGFRNGIIRFSSAIAPQRGKNSIVNMFDKAPSVAPGMGLKAFVNGKESANLVAMWSLDGQVGWNFFQNPWSTYVPSSSSSAIALIAKAFEDASKCPTHISVLPFAAVTERGTVPPNIRSPYALVFVPEKSVSDEISGHLDPAGKSRVKQSESDYAICETVEECPEILDLISALTVPKHGRKLFRVFAIDSPARNPWRNKSPTGDPAYDIFAGDSRIDGVDDIGELWLTSPIQRSVYGDGNLFFKHTAFEDSILHELCQAGGESTNWLKALNYDQLPRSRNYRTCGLGDKHSGTQILGCRLWYRAADNAFRDKYGIPESCQETVARKFQLRVDACQRDNEYKDTRTKGKIPSADQCPMANRI